MTRTLPSCIATGALLLLLLVLVARKHSEARAHRPSVTVVQKSAVSGDNVLTAISAPDIFFQGIIFLRVAREQQLLVASAPAFAVLAVDRTKNHRWAGCYYLLQRGLMPRRQSTPFAAELGGMSCGPC